MLGLKANLVSTSDASTQTVRQKVTCGIEKGREKEVAEAAGSADGRAQVLKVCWCPHPFCLNTSPLEN